MPKDAPWLDEFLHELLGFPNARHDDQVDAFSQLLRRREINDDIPCSLGMPEAYEGGVMITPSIDPRPTKSPLLYDD